jgi:hypothetical protein
MDSPANDRSSICPIDDTAQSPAARFTQSQSQLLLGDELAVFSVVAAVYAPLRQALAPCKSDGS